MNLLQKRYFGLTRDTGGDIAEAVAIPKPAVESQPVRKWDDFKPEPVNRTAMAAEYVALAKDLGLRAPDLDVERFKDWLRAKDWPIFSLSEVIKYMDAKAAKESREKSGWEWKPLREKDHIKDARWGTQARREMDRRYGMNGPESAIHVTSASDFYQGPAERHWQGGGFGSLGASTAGMDMYQRALAAAQQQAAQPRTMMDPSPNLVYDKLVPLHALKKVQTIEKEFDGKVSFFVCDYALAPAIEYPDPFLLAVVPNSRADKGAGRFVIDFWDEPGFGLDKQLA